MRTSRTRDYLRLWLLVIICSILALGRVEAFVSKHLIRTELNRLSSAPTKTSLHLISVPQTTIVSTLGHVVGGVTGTPIVIKATKKGGWYRRIGLPTWTPPDRIFAPVWTILYSCMGYAFSRIGRSTGFLSAPAILWLVHYALNLSWAPMFFGMQRLRLALFVNWGMLATLSAIIPWYWRIDRVAGMLLLPYAAWLIFATALNAEICRLNPTVNGYNEAKLQADLLDLQKKAADFAKS